MAPCPFGPLGKFIKLFKECKDGLANSLENDSEKRLAKDNYVSLCVYVLFLFGTHGTVPIGPLGPTGQIYKIIPEL